MHVRARRPGTEGGVGGGAAEHKCNLAWSIHKCDPNCSKGPRVINEQLTTVGY